MTKIKYGVTLLHRDSFVKTLTINDSLGRKNPIFGPSLTLSLENHGITSCRLLTVMTVTLRADLSPYSVDQCKGHTNQFGVAKSLGNLDTV